MHSGDEACAERSLTAANAVLDEVEGAGSERSVNALSWLRIQQGRGDEAAALLERADVRAKAQSRPPSRTLGELTGNLATAHGMRGDWARALEYAERSRGIFAAALGSDHEILVNATTNVGIIQRELGRLDDSAASLVQAADLARRVFPPTHRDRLNTETELGLSWLALGDDARALQLAQGIAANLVDTEPSVLLAESQFLLARALGPTSPGVREAALRAIETYRSLGERFGTQAALVDAWQVSNGLASTGRASMAHD